VGSRERDGIVERLHRTLLDEHLRVQGHTVWHETVAEMQTALDAWLTASGRIRAEASTAARRSRPSSRAC
jgi:hypothetical protein